MLAWKAALREKITTQRLSKQNVSHAKDACGPYSMTTLNTQ